MEGAAAQRLEEAKRRAIDLIRCYDEQLEPTDALETRNAETFTGASTGFSVLDLHAENLVEDLDQSRYEDLKGFVKNQPHMPRWKSMREFEKKQRREHLKIQKQIEKELEPHDTLDSNTETQKNFIQLNKDLAPEQRKKRDRSKKRRNRPSAIDTSRTDDHDHERLIPGLNSPRSSPPDIYDPGHRTQVAWRGVPKELQKMYYREIELPPGFSPRPETTHSEEDNPSSPLANGNQEIRSNTVLASQDLKHIGTVDKKIHKATVQLSPPVVDETPEQRKERALKFANQYKSDRARSAGTGESRNKAREHEQWMREKARMHRRGKKPSSAKDRSGDPDSVQIESENILENGGKDKDTPRTWHYAEMCRNAREQVLRERIELQKQMERRRDAARVLQRAMRRYLLAIKNKQELDYEVTVKLQKKHRHAIKLQAVFRSHRAKLIVARVLREQTDAAKKVQRMIRNSYNWKRLLKERLQIKKIKERKVQTHSDKEHFEWIQRVVQRTNAEETFRTKSGFGPSKDQLRDWIVFAPQVEVQEEEEQEDRVPISVGIDTGNDECENDGLKSETTLIVKVESDEMPIVSPDSPSSPSIDVQNIPRLNLEYIQSPNLQATDKWTPKTSTQRTKSPAHHASPWSSGRQIPTELLSPDHSFSVKHWNSHRHHTKTEQMNRDNIEVGEMEAVNFLTAEELSNNLSSFRGRARGLQSTVASIVKQEKLLPGLRFLPQQTAPPAKSKSPNDFIPVRPTLTESDSVKNLRTSRRRNAVVQRRRSSTKEGQS